MAVPLSRPPHTAPYPRQAMRFTATHRVAHAHRAHLRVGLLSVLVGAAAERLGAGQQLHVRLNADDGLELNLCALEMAWWVLIADWMKDQAAGSKAHRAGRTAKAPHSPLWLQRLRAASAARLLQRCKPSAAARGARGRIHCAAPWCYEAMPVRMPAAAGHWEGLRSSRGLARRVWSPAPALRCSALTSTIYCCTSSNAPFCVTRRTARDRFLACFGGAVRCVAQINIE